MLELTAKLVSNKGRGTPFGIFDTAGRMTAYQWSRSL